MASHLGVALMLELLHDETFLLGVAVGVGLVLPLLGWLVFVEWRNTKKGGK